jgi:hypothetical protein
MERTKRALTAAAQLGSNRPSPQQGILVVWVGFVFELVDGIG